MWVRVFCPSGWPFGIGEYGTGAASHRAWRRLEGQRFNHSEAYVSALGGWIPEFITGLAFLLVFACAFLPSICLYPSQYFTWPIRTNSNNDLRANLLSRLQSALRNQTTFHELCHKTCFYTLPSDVLFHFSSRLYSSPVSMCTSSLLGSSSLWKTSCYKDKTTFWRNTVWRRMWVYTIVTSILIAFYCGLLLYTWPCRLELQMEL